MLSNQLRRRFIKYFIEQGHRHLPSSSVVPHNDPSLLFCNAGMNQFKSYFLGQEKPPTLRAVTGQKCIRVGGKHNDLENVGHTSRHLTFFEMMGNFSFGDYFKKEAIDFAWDVSTKIFEIDADRLWISVFEDDDEAFALWERYMPSKQIIRLGAKDNFWQMGDVGPCGPCTELLFDRGKEFGSATHPAQDSSGERFFEFWNLVFMQFNREKDGSLKKLPKPSVDTGMGLERLISLKMGVDSVFKTDLLGALIEECEDHFKLKQKDQTGEKKAAYCVIVDHLRCLSFAIADGAVPSNVDRGYVLRKVLRRAVRYGRVLGAQKPFLAQILPKLVHLMHEDYPELKHSQDKIAEILTLEEEAFLRTLARGGNLMNRVVEKANQDQAKKISGDDAFLLKDTYGLPLEELLLMAKDKQLTVDLERFEVLETKAKEISKQVHQSAAVTVSDDFYDSFVQKHQATTFCGYGQTQNQAQILGIVHQGMWVDKLTEKQEGTLILDQSCFYAEKGGQVGDHGSIESPHGLFKVTDTQTQHGLILHHGYLVHGALAAKESIKAHIQLERRQKVACNHTATHLLHWALQKVLGEHVKQAGSLVDDQRLRFDFSHHKAISHDEINEIENLVNGKVRENQAVESYELSYQEAQKKPQIKQFFGDKYGLTVRVIDIEFSKELCGGTHANKTGDIGLIRIVKESSIAAGVRRLEAVSGQAAIDFCKESEQKLIELSLMLKTTPPKLFERIAQLQNEQSQMQEELKELKNTRNQSVVHDLSRNARDIKGIKLICGEVQVAKSELRDLVIQLSQNLKDTVVVVGCSEQESVSVISFVSSDLVAKKISAKDLLSAIIDPIEGKGGGKAELAQAGGVHPKKLPLVFEKAQQYLSQL